MESKALALGKQIKAEALNSSIHLLSVTLPKSSYQTNQLADCDSVNHAADLATIFFKSAVCRADSSG
jgi:hypothetical protein